jgi:hypothetical protein
MRRFRIEYRLNGRKWCTYVDAEVGTDREVLLTRAGLWAFPGCRAKRVEDVGPAQEQLRRAA